MLAREFQRRLSQPIRVRVNGRSANVTPASLGIEVDTAATVREAMDVGRVRATLFPFGYHQTVPPVIVLPKTFAVPAGLQAAALDRWNAALTLSRNGTVVVTLGRAGRSFPVTPSLRAIALASIAQQGQGGGLSRHAEPAVRSPLRAADRAKARVALNAVGSDRRVALRAGTRACCSPRSSRRCSSRRRTRTRSASPSTLSRVQDADSRAS